MTIPGITVPIHDGTKQLGHNGKKTSVNESDSVPFQNHLLSILNSSTEQSSREFTMKDIEVENTERLLPSIDDKKFEIFEELVYQILELLNNFPEDEKNEEYNFYLQSILSFLALNKNDLNMQLSQDESRKPTFILRETLEFIRQYLISDTDEISNKKVDTEFTKMDKLLALIENKIFTNNQLQEQPKPLVTLNFQPVKEIAPFSSFQLEQLQIPKQTVVSLTLNTASNEVAREQLISRIEQMLLKSNVQNFNRNKQFTIRLHPDHLGTLHIKIQQSDAGLIARIIAHSNAAKQLLDSGVSNLKSSLIGNNIQVDKIDIIYQELETRQLSHGRDERQDQHRNKEDSFKEHLDDDVENQQPFSEILNEQFEKHVTGESDD